MKQTNSYFFYLENAITIVLKEKSAKKDSSQHEKHVLHMKAQNYQQFLLKDGPKFKQRRNMAEGLNPPPIDNALYGNSPVPPLQISETTTFNLWQQFFDNIAPVIYGENYKTTRHSFL